MKKLSKKNYIIIAVVALVLITLIVGGTIAYFGWSSAESTVNVTVNSGTGECNSISDNNTVLIPTNAREKGRVIKLKANQQMSSKASITWNLVVNSIGGLKDKTFIYEMVNTTTGVSYGTGNFENINDGDTIVLSNDSELLDYNKDYEFTLYLWINGELGKNPLTMANQDFNFDINCNISGGSTTSLPAAQYISNLYINANKTTVTNNNITYKYAPSASMMNDRLGGTTSNYDAGNIRYYGPDPNNYIYFNCSDYSNQTASTCELWRIIGVFGDKVKIIRNDSIGAYSWDNKDKTTDAETDNGKNDWTDARLMKLLNPGYEKESIGGSLYYNAGSGSCYSNTKNNTTTCNFASTGLKNNETRNKIAEVTWNLGGITGDAYELYSNQIYNHERGNATYQNSRPTTWTGKVALMYPSDYGYAVDFTECTYSPAEYNANLDLCAYNDWLFLHDFEYSYFTLTSISDDPDYVMITNAGGSVSADYTNNYLGNNLARPTLFLNSTEVIDSKIGTGTQTNPYRLK